MENSHILLQRLCLGLSFTFHVFVEANRTKIAIPLIHHDSISSPFYKSKLSAPPDDIRGPLVTDKSRTIFLVNVSIGEPPVPQLLGMDTGSKLTWVDTTCSPNLGPVFDPKSSSTYNKVPCSSSHQCFNYFYRSSCEIESHCSYEISYADETYSSGILAYDKFTFETSDGGIMEFPNVVFGCGLENKWKPGEIRGVFGLEPIGQHSLTTVLGKKFSYCLGNISDSYYMYNRLILGEGAYFEGPSTPLEYRNRHFVVNFKGISVGEKRLEIDEKELGFNTVIDSGTTFTMLSRGVYDLLREEIVNLMDGLMQPVELDSADERLCYFGNLARDLKGFPVVSLHFVEGADLDLNVEALFRRRTDSVFCLGVDAAKDDQVNIVGVYAQQYYNVGFDMNVMRVSFQHIDCALLED